MKEEQFPWLKYHQLVVDKKPIMSLERANTRMHRYASEIGYCNKIIQALYEYLIFEKVSKVKTNKILDEIDLWKHRRNQYYQYVRNIN